MKNCWCECFKGQILKQQINSIFVLTYLMNTVNVSVNVIYKKQIMFFQTHKETESLTMKVVTRMSQFIEQTIYNSKFSGVKFTIYHD